GDAGRPGRDSCARGAALRPVARARRRRLSRRALGRGHRHRIHFLWPRHACLAYASAQPTHAARMTLHVANLCKDYPTRSGPLAVLRGISLDVAPGEALAVMGPSGSGKSTLLHILGTLDRPTTGDVRLNERDPFALSEPELADFRNKNIGFVFQD